MEGPDFTNISNIQLIESLYESYQQDPHAVDSSWRHFFQGMDFTKPPGKGADIRSYIMIEKFRRKGHRFATVNPLSSPEKTFSIKEFGFQEEELDKLVDTFGVLDKEKAPLKELYEALKRIYCHRVGYEFMHTRSEIRDWLLERIETEKPIELSLDERKRVIEHLNKSEILETFLHTKFVGQKRFSVEGNETLMPVLYTLIECGAENGVEEIVIGMAHRGRLNVLANIMNKSYAMIFHEFDEKYVPKEYELFGDVKYHKGFSRDYLTPTGKDVHLHLAANPSHLETVDSVVLGQTRAKQDLRRDKKVESLLIHGDASIAGQGIIYETMQFINLEGYKTNGSVHVVVNNQIGFTAVPTESRSTEYCTDIAKPFGCVIFHVNAEDPEGCVYVSKLACQIRAKFGIDVFIDLIGYRKYGHNEADEPFFTQPILYTQIKSKETIRDIYQKWLIDNNLMEKSVLEALEKEFRDELQEALDATKEFLEKTPEPEEMMGGYWNNFVQPDSKTIFDPVHTKVPYDTLQKITEQITNIPEGFSLHPKLAKAQELRRQIITQDPKDKLIDWGFAEQLAFGTILAGNIPIRLSGQDARRGTFNHRHAVWIDQVTNAKYFPISTVDTDEYFDIYNSPLSEYAALGFEYGYSLSNPKALVIWEAQFGDFCNGAQIVIDQCISTSEEKWSRYTSLVMLLPHGYEGGGPEHSSSRIERFLELCGDLNMIVVNVSTPAQLFHLMRRQAIRPLKKPLIVFTPKSLLRHPECKSAVSDLTEKEFEEILPDPNKVKNPRKLLLCTGKIFYDLDAFRKANNRDDIAIIRIEQIYPLHEQKLKHILAEYSSVKDIYWVQEEPENMGAYAHLALKLKKHVFENVELKYIGRRASGSPSTGSSYIHKQEQQAIIEKAFE